MAVMVMSFPDESVASRFSDAYSVSLGPPRVCRANG
ncbi:hypothetical protein MMUC44124_14755 [Mycolicibacterium mucogenicum DSM 44124]|nr:hypothetical protein MMUC44124_14755 [Mycolicibacterium mucogenicum DSM 44124]